MIPSCVSFSLGAPSKIRVHTHQRPWPEGLPRTWHLPWSGKRRTPARPCFPHGDTGQTMVLQTGLIAVRPPRARVARPAQKEASNVRRSKKGATANGEQWMRPARQTRTRNGATAQGLPAVSDERPLIHSLRAALSKKHLLHPSACPKTLCRQADSGAGLAPSCGECPLVAGRLPR